MSKVRVKFFGLIVICILPFILFGYWFNAKTGNGTKGFPQVHEEYRKDRRFVKNDDSSQIHDSYSDDRKIKRDISMKSDDKGKSLIRRRDREDTVVIYNRVPKTGSTSFIGLAYSLCKRNRYHVLHVNVTRNNHILSLTNQMRFARNITRWKTIKPALYHGHFAHVDFPRFQIAGGKRPYYINIIRDPLERFVSYYYFLRFGDDFRPNVKRHRMRNKRTQKQTFDECVKTSGHDCDPKRLWLQVPFFCGHAAYCWSEPGNRQALETAKRNLVNEYLLVGITDMMSDFVIMMEALLPRFFSGATTLYNEGGKSGRRSTHMRRTFGKKALLPETIEVVHQWPAWQAEQEFYEFARTHFVFIRDQMYTREEGYDWITWSKQKVRYEKIRPRQKFSSDRISNTESSVAVDEKEKD